MYLIFLSPEREKPFLPRARCFSAFHFNAKRRITMPHSKENATSTENTQPSGYYSPIFTSLGWLNKVRFVDGHKGKPFWSASIVCPRGSYEDYDTELVQTIVKGEQAIELIDKYFDAINDPESKITIVTNIGDLRPDSYVDGEGNTCLVMKGSLLRIRYMKVNGEVVYREEGQEEDQPQADAPKASKRQPERNTQSRVQPDRSTRSGGKPPVKRSKNTGKSRQAAYAG